MIFCNDSCYGPLWSLKEIVDKKSFECNDFWGLVKSTDGDIHIQSFFYVFKKNVFRSIAFISFVETFKHQDNFWGYVNNYERRFTRILINEGFSYSTVVNVPNEIEECIENVSGNRNITTWPVTAINCGFPLVKIKALTNGFGEDLREGPYETLAKIGELNPQLATIVKQDLKYKNVVYPDHLIPVEELISDQKVVSFDIFDTLLIRPFKNPTDLFSYIEGVNGLCGFTDSRILAEKKAREKHPEKKDISIDEIYAEIRSDFKKCKSTELLFEKELLLPNPKILKYYNEAVKKNKRIIATSDMYLSSDFLSAVLTEKGFRRIEKVYVSNEFNKVKFDGTCCTTY